MLKWAYIRIINTSMSLEASQPEFQVNEEGKKYKYEKGGVFYGGEYLDEPPAEISTNDDLPPPPEETIHPAL